MHKVNIQEIISIIDLDFSKFFYKNNYTKSEIVCKTHGSFYRTIKQIRLNYNITKDNIKKNYCLDNNIKLFIIKYDADIENEIF